MSDLSPSEIKFELKDFLIDNLGADAEKYISDVSILRKGPEIKSLIIKIIQDLNNMGQKEIGNLLFMRMRIWFPE